MDDTGTAKPSLRDRRREETRQAILEAIAELEIVHGGAIDPSIITYSRIAEIAGVSERTVYRFFPTKSELDHAYGEARPIGLGLTFDVTDMESYAAAIEAIGRRWTERIGHVRITEHEVGTDDYPETMARRRERDAQLVDMLLDERPELKSLPEVQTRAIAAVINHTLSVRSLAIIAQRWNLTIEEATRIQAWAARAIVTQLATDTPQPWNG